MKANGVLKRYKLVFDHIYVTARVLAHLQLEGCFVTHVGVPPCQHLPTRNNINTVCTVAKLIFIADFH